MACTVADTVAGAVAAASDLTSAETVACVIVGAVDRTVAGIVGHAVADTVACRTTDTTARAVAGVTAGSRVGSLAVVMHSYCCWSYQHRGPIRRGCLDRSSF